MSRQSLEIAKISREGIPLRGQKTEAKGQKINFDLSVQWHCYSAQLTLGETLVALTRQAKESIIAEVSDVASKALSAVVALNHGLTAAETTELRAKARKMQVYLRVVPNTLLSRAVKGTAFECLDESLSGPTMIVFSKADPGSAGRLIRDFAKGHEKLGVKALAIGGQAFEAKQLDMLATLPTRDEALAILLSVMQAPVTKLVRTTSETYAKLVRTVAAVRDQKQAA